MKTSNSITVLPTSPEVDLQRRFRRYVWQMSFRVVFFVGGVAIYMAWHTWLCVVPMVLAAIIPWVAVVLANAGSRDTGDTLLAPAGAVVSASAIAARDAEEDRRAAAYRAEQDRLRREAQAEQTEWQRRGAPGRGRDQP